MSYKYKHIAEQLVRSYDKITDINLDIFKKLSNDTLDCSRNSVSLNLNVIENYQNHLFYLYFVLNWQRLNVQDENGLINA